MYRERVKLLSFFKSRVLDSVQRIINDGVSEIEKREFIEPDVAVLIERVARMRVLDGWVIVKAGCFGVKIEIIQDGEEEECFDIYYMTNYFADGMEVYESCILSEDERTGGFSTDVKADEFFKIKTGYLVSEFSSNLVVGNPVESLSAAESLGMFLIEIEKVQDSLELGHIKRMIELEILLRYLDNNDVDEALRNPWFTMMGRTLSGELRNNLEVNIKIPIGIDFSE